MTRYSIEISISFAARVSRFIEAFRRCAFLKHLDVCVYEALSNRS